MQCGKYHVNLGVPLQLYFGTKRERRNDSRHNWEMKYCYVRTVGFMPSIFSFYLKTPLLRSSYHSEIAHLWHLRVAAFYFEDIEQNKWRNVFLVSEYFNQKSKHLGFSGTVCHIKCRSLHGRIVCMSIVCVSVCVSICVICGAP